MTDTTPLLQNGAVLEHPRLPGRYIHTARGRRGRVRFADPAEPGAWLEADEQAVCEVGVDE